MNRVQLLETDLAYLEQGSGTAVVFVHGTVSDLRSWRLQLSHFSHRYRAIAYSRRYHFPNPPPSVERPYSAALHADDLAHFLDRLQLNDVHLVGGSFGGYVSLIFALRHPVRVKSLVLAEPPILPFLHRSDAGRMLFSAFMQHAWNPARTALKEGNDEAGVRSFIDGVMGKGAFDSFTEGARHRLMQNAPDLRAETESAEYFTEVTDEMLASLRLPVLLLNGELSPPMFGAITDELERLLPNSRRVTIPRASHGMNAQNADEFNRVVDRFLTSHI
ncbi:MAG: alpha/beta hydrolase [Bacteroidetes bacterium]|nr:alpha/beta hydrolase [Bacteroidota bacterium]